MNYPNISEKDQMYLLEFRADVAYGLLSFLLIQNLSQKRDRHKLTENVEFGDIL